MIQAEYIDHMGDDLRVVNAARVSFAKESEALCHDDERLIAYLARHKHFTPFAHPQITLRETVPIFVARQRFKHVVGFIYNEVSRRYVSDEPEFFVPDGWRAAAENVKQGSSDEKVHSYETLFEGRKATTVPEAEYEEFLALALKVYREMIAGGVAPEQARMVLPQSMLTSYYVTGSLMAFARAYGLRADPHAQKEIRELASQWDAIISPRFPIAWRALVG